VALLNRWPLKSPDWCWNPRSTAC